MKNLKVKLIYTLIFAISMGFMESSVVVYLRELYYPQGFFFPLKGIPEHIAKVEFFREIATILMLIAIGYFNGKSKLERFAWFTFAFAIWDLFYYVFLYVVLAWPDSIFTWDILFLVPLPWVGPVWAPCLISLLMIFGSIFILHRKEQNPLFRIAKKWWFILISGAVICIGSFMTDFIIQVNDSERIMDLMLNPGFHSDVERYVPKDFNEVFFFSGFLLMCLSVFSQVPRKENEIDPKIG